MHSSVKPKKADASSKASPFPKDIPKEQLPELTKALILRYLSRRCVFFDTQLEAAGKSSDLSGRMMMSIFRFPLVTFLSDSTFKEFGNCLAEFTGILQKGIDKVEAYHVYSLLSLL